MCCLPQLYKDLPTLWPHTVDENYLILNFLDAELGTPSLMLSFKYRLIELKVKNLSSGSLASSGICNNAIFLLVFPA